MGKPLLGVNVPKLIYANMKNIMFAGTFTKNTPGTRNPAAPSSGTQPTAQTYSCKGFAAQYSQYYLMYNLVRNYEFTIILLVLSLPSGIVPAPDDQIQLTGDPILGAKIARITSKGIERDPTGAVYTCHVKAGGS